MTKQTHPETTTTTPTDDDSPRERLRQAVRFFYDLQKLRIQVGNRSGSTTAVLDDHDKAFHESRSATLKELEKAELKHIEKLCKPVSIYEWLDEQKGIGPTLAGVIIAEVDITRAGTVSALWKFTGLDVQNGTAPRKTKGQKRTYNAWLRTKLVGVAADCMLKARSPWREYYDNYKTRKMNQRVDECMGCEGTGKAKKGERKGKKCPNCNGTGGPAPWGESDGHRHRAALRYMIKQFLLAMWREWRTREGLPTPDVYAEAYLNRKHGDHGGTVASTSAP